MALVCRPAPGFLFLGVVTLLHLAWLMPLSSARQANDYHLTLDPARSFYLRSVFAHGHRHGYEEGYHAADVDYHLGRNPMAYGATSKSKSKLPPMMGYKHEFGDKQIFHRGYDEGFLAGYADSYAGREFREAAQIAAQEASSLQPTGHPLQAGASIAELEANRQARVRAFDSGVVEGYQAGAKAGEHQEQLAASGTAPAKSCNTLRQAKPADYCAGFASGFVMGRADSSVQSGFANDAVIRMARNSRD